MNKWKKFRTSFCVVLSIFSFFLVSCGHVSSVPSDLKPADILGTWELNGPDGKISSFTFNSDLTFQAHNLPKDAFSTAYVSDASQLSWNDLVSYSGTWKLYYLGSTAKVMLIDGVNPSTNNFYVSSASDKLLLQANAAGGEGQMDFLRHGN